MEKLGKPFVWVRLSGSKLICGFLNFSTIIPGLMKALLSVGMLPWARIYKEPRVAGLLPHQAPPELCPLLTDFIFDKQEKGCKIHAFFEKLSQHLGQSILFTWDDLIGSSCGLIFKTVRLKGGAGSWADWKEHGFDGGSPEELSSISCSRVQLCPGFILLNPQLPTLSSILWGPYASFQSVPLLFIS